MRNSNGIIRGIPKSLLNPVLWEEERGKKEADEKLKQWEGFVYIDDDEG